MSSIKEFISVATSFIHQYFKGQKTKKDFNMQIKEPNDIEKDYYFSLSFLKFIIDEKDNILERILSILEEVSINNENSFNIAEEEELKIFKLRNDLNKYLEQRDKTVEEINYLKRDLHHLHIAFLKEEGAYETILDMKEHFSNEIYNQTRFKSLLVSLKIADKINQCEISLIEKEQYKTYIDNKCILVENTLKNIELCKYRELCSIKNSLNTAILFAQKALPYQLELIKNQATCRTHNQI